MTYQSERKRALKEIQQMLTDKMTERARAVGNPQHNSLPEYLQTQETFRLFAVAIVSAAELHENVPLARVFSRVSARYDARAAQSAPVLAEDFNPSSRARADGRASAFEDMLKTLAIAERDFDLTYQPLSPEQIRHWQTMHPIAPEHLHFAHKENTRHFMKEAAAALRALIEDLENPAPGATPPKGPKP